MVVHVIHTVSRIARKPSGQQNSRCFHILKIRKMNEDEESHLYQEYCRTPCFYEVRMMMGESGGMVRNPLLPLGIRKERKGQISQSDLHTGTSRRSDRG